MERLRKWRDFSRSQERSKSADGGLIRHRSQLGVNYDDNIPPGLLPSYRRGLTNPIQDQTTNSDTIAVVADVHHVDDNELGRRSSRPSRSRTRSGTRTDGTDSRCPTAMSMTTVESGHVSPTPSELKEAWGHTRLLKGLAYPARLFLTKDQDPEKRDKALNRLSDNLSSKAIASKLARDNAPQKMRMQSVVDDIGHLIKDRDQIFEEHYQLRDHHEKALKDISSLQAQVDSLIDTVVLLEHKPSAPPMHLDDTQHATVPETAPKNSVITEPNLTTLMAQQNELIAKLIESRQSSRHSTRASSRRSLSPTVEKRIKEEMLKHNKDMMKQSNLNSLHASMVEGHPQATSQHAHLQATNIAKEPEAQENCEIIQHTALLYDLTPSHIVTQSTIQFWKAAQKAVLICEDLKNPMIKNMAELRSRPYRQIYEDIQKLHFENRLQFQPWLASLRIYLLQNNIQKNLIIEIVKNKVYADLTNFLQSKTQSLELRTEEDLTKLLTRHIYAGYTSSTLGKKFDDINKQRVNNGSDIVAIYSDIHKSQAQILADLSEIPAVTADQRELLVKIFSKQLLRDCIPKEQESVLGLQGLLDIEDTTKMVEGLSRLNLYTKQNHTKVAALNAMEKGAMQYLDKIHETDKPAKPSTNTDELHRLREKVKKQDIALKEKEEALKKKTEVPREKNDARKWTWPQCQACVGTSVRCRHCRKHSTPEYIIDYASCTDPACLKQKERAALQKGRSQ